MATPKKHTVRAGESLASIALKQGFSDPSTLLENEDNRKLVEQRGGAHKLVPGDELSIERATGSKKVGTGRAQTFKTGVAIKLLELRTSTEFRLFDPKNAGDKDKTFKRWGGPGLLLATAEFTSTGKETRGGHTSTKQKSVKKGKKTLKIRSGSLHVQSLEDGTWTLKLTPQAEETSSGAVLPEPKADHGLGFWEASKGKLVAKNSPKKKPPKNGQFELEYRALEIEVTVAGGEIIDAKVVDTKRRTARPHHATIFWKNVGKSPLSGVSQVLEIDIKPDFIRRVVLTTFLVNQGPKGKKKGKASPRKYLGLSPFQRERKSGKTTITKQAHGIEILVLHQTTGNRVGSAINTFATNYEGATAKVGGKSITGKSSLHSGSQFILDVDGHFIRMADDRYFTQHGGGSFGYKKRTGKRKPFWAGGGEINERALGIEIAHGDKGNDSDLKASPYTEAQYVAVIDLAKEVKKTYGVRSQDIVGHQDVTGKVRCPGPHLHWERLETDGATLKPRPLAKADIDAMFGGFFAGTDGAKRKLKFDDKAEAIAAGKFRIVRGDEEIATGLGAWRAWRGP